MARETFVYDHVNQKLIAKHLRSSPIEVQRSDFPCPSYQADGHIPAQSQLDGKMYDSKSELLRSYKDYGQRTGKRVEIVGDQMHHLMKEEPEVADEKAIDACIKKSLEQVGF